MKRAKPKCSTCQDSGEFTNPFDQTFKCYCRQKKRKPTNYRAFVLHIWEWNEKGIPFGMSDLRELANKYNVPIPTQYRNDNNASIS